MKNFLFGVLGVAFLFPQTSSAWFTTAQHATRLNEDTVLYTVTYQFGTPKYALSMPNEVERGIAMGESASHLGYVIEDDGVAYEGGEEYSVILSSAEIRDGAYYVPQGKAHTFTLITLLKLPEGDEEENLDLALQVTALPFTMISEGDETPGKLNPSELQYYRTPEVDM